MLKVQHLMWIEKLWRESWLNNGLVYHHKKLLLLINLYYTKL